MNDDHDIREYAPGPWVEVWDGDDLLHEVERIWGWSESWEIVRVDGIPWENVPADTRTMVEEYIEHFQPVWESRARRGW